MEKGGVFKHNCVFKIKRDLGLFRAVSVPPALFGAAGFVVGADVVNLVSRRARSAPRPASPFWATVGAGRQRRQWESASIWGLLLGVPKRGGCGLTSGAACA